MPASTGTACRAGVGALSWAAPQKCLVYGADANEAARVAERLQFQHAEQGMICFGTPIGTDQFVLDSIKQRADGVVAEIERLMALPAPVTLQMKWRLLQASLSVRMEHLKRTVPFELLRVSLQSVERELQDAAARVFQLPADPAGNAACAPDVLEQLTLPLRHAGFGLRVTTADDADAALLSGVAAAEATMAAGHPSFRPLADGSAVRASLLQRWHRLYDAYGERCGWLEDGRDLPADFVRDWLPLAGHAVSRAVTDARGAALLAGCDLEDAAGEAKAARLRSSIGSAAGAWLTAMPVVPATRLSDRDFRMRGRHQLGLGLATAALQPPCTCVQGIASAPDHAMVCDHAKGDARLRHDYITDVWCSYARKAMFAVSREPRYDALIGGHHLEALVAAGQRRGDFTALVDGCIMVGDVVIGHPGAATYKRAAARSNGATAKRLATHKHSEWRRIGDGEGKRFVALALETWGRHGDEALKLMSQLGDSIEMNGGNKATFVRALRTELSCALTKGLGRMYAKTELNVIRAAGQNFKLGHECVVSGHCDE